MKKHLNLLASAVLAIGVTFGTAACVSTKTPTASPTERQHTIANAVGDTLAIGLVPVLTKNASYIPAAQTVAAALRTFSGDTFSAADVSAVLAKTPLSSEDARTVAGIVNAAWATYNRRYAQQVGEQIRPDVKLFLGAMADGIEAAIAATPKPTAQLPTRVRYFGAVGLSAIS